jgi:hypothetical protein
MPQTGIRGGYCTGRSEFEDGLGSGDVVAFIPEAANETMHTLRDSMGRYLNEVVDQKQVL